MKSYEKLWTFADTPREQMAPERQTAIAEAEARARADFAGRGADVARHFLTYTDRQVANEGYWFVLGALADPGAAALLIRALPQPPDVVAGVLPRDQGEIRIALETMITAPALAASDAVAGELVTVIRAWNPRLGPPDMAIELLGRSRTTTARAALAGMLADPAPSVRGLAAKALREGAGEGGAGEIPLGGLVRVLEGDADPRARAEAATTIAEIGGEEGLAALHRALEAERAPEAVDAMVEALEKHGAPVIDPARCRVVVDRSAEPPVARPCFERWRQTADRAALVEAAETGGPVLRLLAISALVERPLDRSLFGGDPPPPDLDLALRQRLLASLRDVLTATAASPSNVPWMAQQAIWDVSGHDVAAALPYVDGVEPRAARFAALRDLAGRDPDGYARARRPMHLAIALAVAVGGALLLVLPVARAAGLAVLLSGVVWAIFLTQATGVRYLPPPALSVLTVPAIGLLSGGLVAAVVSWIAARRGTRGLKRLVWVVVMVAGAPVLAVLVAGWSRAEGLFPIGGEGMEIVIDPLLAGVLATVWAAVLAGAIEVMRALGNVR